MNQFKEQAESQKLAVAKVLMALVKILKQNPSKEVEEWCKSTLVVACRKLECFVTPAVSEKAAEKASKQGLRDISRFRWNDQKTKMSDPKRETFHWEHALPVSEIIKRLMDFKVLTEEDVIHVITQADVAWILKSENESLDKKGYKSSRPAKPYDAYSEVGITLIRK